MLDTIYCGVRDINLCKIWHLIILLSTLFIRSINSYTNEILSVIDI